MYVCIYVCVFKVIPNQPANSLGVIHFQAVEGAESSRELTGWLVWNY